MDLCFILERIDCDTLDSQLKNYAFELFKQGAAYETSLDQERALIKYQCALFVIEELMRELCHSLKSS